MKRLIVTVLFIAVLFSCKKDKTPDVVETPIPEVTTGNLSGTVEHYNQFGLAYTISLNTTTVTIDSTDKVCITDTKGHYSFPNMSNGIYTLIFKKPGCGLKKILNVNYKYTDTTTYNTSVADIPGFSINNAYVKDTTWFNPPLPGIYYGAGTFPFNKRATIVAIIGKSPDISLGEPLSYIKFSPASLADTIDYGRFLSYAFLSQSYGFKKDSVIFVKIYPVSAVGASYYDNNLKKPVFTAYGNPSPIFTLTIPQ